MVSAMTNEHDCTIVTYEDGESVVLCDRENPKAWIRSDAFVTGESAEGDQTAMS